VRGETSAACDFRYGVSAGHNYRIDLKPIILAGQVSTGHDYIYSLLVGYDFRCGLTAGNEFIYDYWYGLSAGQNGVARLRAIYDCKIVLATGQDIRAVFYKLRF